MERNAKERALTMEVLVLIVIYLAKLNKVEGAHFKVPGKKVWDETRERRGDVLSFYWCGSFRLHK